MSSIYSIYCITNIVTNKKYIGFTKRSTEKRFRTHISEANRNLYGMYLHNSIRKYGKENFIVETLMSNLSYDDAARIETETILLTNTIQPHGYNEHQGGKGGCKNLSEELRKKLSSAKKGCTPWNKDKVGKQDAWNLRKDKTSDNRILQYGLKISIALKGKPKSDEHKKKIKESLRLRNQYYAIDEAGDRHKIESITEFAKDNDVGISTIYQSIRKNLPLNKTKFKGWIFYKVDPLFNRVESIPQT